MRVVQMTLNDDLVKSVDQAARKLRISRSAFTREALQAALSRLRQREAELRHRAGYENKPVKKGEFDDWAREQVWPE